MVYSETSQTSKVELFAQILKVEKLLTILVERSASDAWHGSEYVCPPWITWWFWFFYRHENKGRNWELISAGNLYVGCSNVKNGIE